MWSLCHVAVPSGVRKLNNTSIGERRYLQKSVVFSHHFVPQNPAHNRILRRPHSGRVGPWLQLNLVFDYIGETVCPFVPSKPVAYVFNCLGMDQFSVGAHIVLISTTRLRRYQVSSPVEVPAQLQ